MRKPKHRKPSPPSSEEQQSLADQQEQESTQQLAIALDARAKKARFLKEFRHHKVVAIAARRIGIDRRTVYRWTADDAEFKSDLTNLQEEIVDQLEKVLNDLATGKLERPLVSAGKLVAMEKIYSERALELLLKAYRPKLYRERTTTSLEVSGSVEQSIKIEKKEVTVALVADVTKLLVEAGVVDPEGRVNSAGDQSESVAATLALAKAKRLPESAA